MSDLIRAHEGNEDVNAADRSKVHWGKFNMIGKFISSTTQCQAQCRTTTDYDFPARPRIRDLLVRDHLMDDEVSLSASLAGKSCSFLHDTQMQKSRIAPPDPDALEDARLPYLGRTISRDGTNAQTKGAVFRTIFSW